MRVDFNESFPVPIEQAFSYFPTPHDWVRLFAFDGRVIDHGNGWYKVGLKRFPISLITRVDIVVPNHRVHWIMGGIWRGEGDVNFSPTPNGTTIHGFEEIHIPHLLGIGPWLERRYLQRPFERLWESGWKRLRRQTLNQDRGAAVNPVALEEHVTLYLAERETSEARDYFFAKVPVIDSFGTKTEMWAECVMKNKSGVHYRTFDGQHIGVYQNTAAEGPAKYTFNDFGVDTPTAQEVEARIFASRTPGYEQKIDLLTHVQCG